MIPGSATLFGKATVGPTQGQTAPPTIFAPGTGYTVGDVLTFIGGVFLAQFGPASIIVTAVSSGAVTAFIQNNGGWYTSIPPNHISLSGGTGSGFQVDATWSVGSPSFKYATFDLATKPADLSFTGSNLIASTTDNSLSYGTARSTIAKSTGQHDAEYTITAIGTYAAVGVLDTLLNPLSRIGSDTHGWGYENLGHLLFNNVTVQTVAAYTTGDVISVLWDADAHTLVFWKNGTPQGTPIAGVTGVLFTGWSGHDATLGSVGTANFGASAFSFAPPGGYVGWYQ